MGLLKIGDTVMWRGSWGTENPQNATVEAIEIDCENKTGKSVTKVEWSKVNEDVIVTLDNGHWAYGYQITQL